MPNWSGRLVYSQPAFVTGCARQFDYARHMGRLEHEVTLGNGILWQRFW